MRTNIALAGLGTLTAFLIVTNPVVADAARTITGKDIKNNSITGKDVKDESLLGADVAGGSLGGAQIQDDSLTGADISESSLGKVPNAASADQVKDAGVTAQALANGAVTGRSFGTVTQATAEIIVASGKSEFKTVNCPPGTRALGGGAYWNDVSLSDANAANLHLVYSNATANGWQARGFNATGDNDASLEVSVMCVS